MADLSGYRFTKTHEWMRRDGDVAVVGITDHAQSALGDVIFLDLPAVGATLKAGERFGAIESVKAASDLYAPVSGTVVEINTALADTPEQVNSAPYTDGWMIKLGDVGDDEAGLIDAAAYEALAAE